MEWEKKQKKKAKYTLVMPSVERKKNSEEKKGYWGNAGMIPDLKITLRK